MLDRHMLLMSNMREETDEDPRAGRNEPRALLPLFWCRWCVHARVNGQTYGEVVSHLH